MFTTLLEIDFYGMQPWHPFAVEIMGGNIPFREHIFACFQFISKTVHLTSKGYRDQKNENLILNTFTSIHLGTAVHTFGTNRSKMLRRHIHNSFSMSKCRVTMVTSKNSSDIELLFIC